MQSCQLARGLYDNSRSSLRMLPPVLLVILRTMGTGCLTSIYTCSSWRICFQFVCVTTTLVRNVKRLYRNKVDFTRIDYIYTVSQIDVTNTKT